MSRHALPTDSRLELLQEEIDSDRRAERWLVLKAALALAFVGALIAIRMLFFS